MKLEIANEEIGAWVMKLIPETPQEQQALHDIQYRGIRSTSLLGCRTPRQDLEFTLGPDYILQGKMAGNQSSV